MPSNVFHFYARLLLCTSPIHRARTWVTSTWFVVGKCYTFYIKLIKPLFYFSSNMEIILVLIGSAFTIFISTTSRFGSPDYLRFSPAWLPFLVCTNATRTIESSIRPSWRDAQGSIQGCPTFIIFFVLLFAAWERIIITRLPTSISLWLYALATQSKSNNPKPYIV